MYTSFTNKTIYIYVHSNISFIYNQYWPIKKRTRTKLSIALSQKKTNNKRIQMNDFHYFILCIFINISYIDVVFTIFSSINQEHYNNFHT